MLDEKVMIKAEVEDKAPKTQDYISYILTKFVERFPLREMEMIDVDINESKTPFPKIRETTDYYEGGKLTIPDADYTRERREARTAALNKYHAERFNELCALINPSEVVGDILRARLKFTVIDPEKIYAECKKYGVSIPDKEGVLKNTNPVVAKFYNDPPRIMWNGGIVPIKYNSRQQDVCRLAFQRPVNEVIQWDEIATAIDPAILRDTQKGRRSIRFAIYRINQKVEEECGRPLFALQDKSFYRVA